MSIIHPRREIVFDFGTHLLKRPSYLQPCFIRYSIGPACDNFHPKVGWQYFVDRGDDISSLFRLLCSYELVLRRIHS